MLASNCSTVRLQPCQPPLAAGVLQPPSLLPSSSSSMLALSPSMACSSSCMAASQSLTASATIWPLYSSMSASRSWTGPCALPNLPQSLSMGTRSARWCCSNMPTIWSMSPRWPVLCLALVVARQAPRPCWYRSVGRGAPWGRFWVGMFSLSWPGWSQGWSWWLGEKMGWCRVGPRCLAVGFMVLIIGSQAQQYAKYHDSCLVLMQLLSHQMPASTPWPDRPEQANSPQSRLISRSLMMSATSSLAQAPLTSDLLAQNRQGICVGISLFSSSSSSSERATLMRSRSEASMTKMMPSILLAEQLALDCHSPRYLDSPDMSKTSKSMPLREKEDFLNPMVGVMPVSSRSGSMMRDRMVVFPLLSNPTSRSLPSEFPMFILQSPAALYNRHGTIAAEPTPQQIPPHRPLRPHHRSSGRHDLPSHPRQAAPVAVPAAHLLSQGPVLRRCVLSRGAPGTRRDLLADCCEGDLGRDRAQSGPAALHRGTGLCAGLEGGQEQDPGWQGRYTAAVHGAADVPDPLRVEPGRQAAGERNPALQVDRRREGAAQRQEGAANAPGGPLSHQLSGQVYHTVPGLPHRHGARAVGPHPLHHHAVPRLGAAGAGAAPRAHTGLGQAVPPGSDGALQRYAGVWGRGDAGHRQEPVPGGQSQVPARQALICMRESGQISARQQAQQSLDVAQDLLRLLAQQNCQLGIGSGYELGIVDSRHFYSDCWRVMSLALFPLRPGRLLQVLGHTDLFHAPRNSQYNIQPTQNQPLSVMPAPRACSLP